MDYIFKVRPVSAGAQQQMVWNKCAFICKEVHFNFSIKIAIYQKKAKKKTVVDACICIIIIIIEFVG